MVLKNKNKEYGCVLNKQEIIELVNNHEIILKPFDLDMLGPADINIRIGKKYARINYNSSQINLKILEDDNIHINKNEHILIESYEYIGLPNYIIGILGLRSTYSRIGFSTPPTFIDPGFKGKIVLHLIGSNFSYNLKPFTPVFKLILLRVSPTTPYSGKYQNQNELIGPIF